MKLSGRPMRMVFVRATLCLTLVLSVFALTVTTVDYYRSVDSAEGALLSRSEEIARSAATAVAGLAGAGNTAAIDGILTDLVSKQDVMHAWILDRDGNSYRTAEGSPSSEAFRAETIAVMASRQPSRLYGDMSLLQLQPILVNNRSIGAVAIRMSMDRVEQVKYDSIMSGAMIASLILLLFTPVGAYFMFRLARGITQVTEAANEAASGFLGTDFPVNSSGEVGELQSAFRTMITELRSNMRQIEAMASQDAVTKLLNRNSFLLAARKAVELTPRARGACLMLEVTRYGKAVEEHGYVIGDKLMVAAAARISRVIDDFATRANLQGATLASFSSDKFCILLPGIVDTAPVEALGNALVEAVSKPFNIENLPIVVGGASGAALYPEHGATADELVRSANSAITTLKARNGGAIYLFTSKDKEDEAERERLEEDLWMALDGEEMSVVYQPKIDLATDRVVGAEALLRWQHSELGQISPARFIPIAAACGMITPIGEYVLRRAIEDSKKLTDRGHQLSISVNIDPIQFRNPDFAEWVCDVVADTGFPTKSIELEISENLVSDDPTQANSHLSAISQSGIRLMLDGFGREASRLQDLAQLPFDGLKIDRSFTNEITKSDRHRVVTQLMLTMAKQLQIEAVAEGVETELQRDLLKAWGANSAQGYLWSAPVPFDKYGQFVEEYNSRNPMDVSRRAARRA
ncbi:putative bifunctional diguanylate cyclase/phosphodiesterase [Roseibium sp.]|uniref:putative bifunctional diguanylate cyclase/phosphodiesterase n=1 Tax=Roseibium sp. TaxID=1936156 RepID=UPI003A987E04